MLLKRSKICWCGRSRTGLGYAACLAPAASSSFAFE